MKNKKRFLAVALAFIMLFASMPIRSSNAGSWEGCRDIRGTIIWHGGDPLGVDILINIQTALLVYKSADVNMYDDNYNAIRGVTVSLWPNTYRGNGEWSFNYWLQYTDKDMYGDPFIGLSRTTLDGKWYCDKWAWNNMIYQPGQYGSPEGSVSYNVNFFLTSSASTANSITVNRTWEAGAPPVDTTLNVYRRYDTRGGVYKVVKYVLLPAGQSSVTINGLYGGNYFVTQTLPDYYDDDLTATHTSVAGIGFDVELENTTAATVSLANTYDPPVACGVTVSSLTGGAITPSKTSAFAGEPISLTVTPEANKQLKAGTLKYTDSSGDHPISGTSFTMPAEAVTISAEFEPKQYTVSTVTVSGGTVSADKSTAASGETVNVTVTPDAGKEMRPGTLKYNDSSGEHGISGGSFTMPQSNVTISAQFQTPVSITTASLPDGMKGNGYSATASVRDGWPPYTWSAEGLPNGLSIDEDTGEISGTPTESGSFAVTLALKDKGGTTGEKTLNLYINDRCGNGAYLITPDASANYTRGYADGGLPSMTVKSGVSGFKTFSVSILPQTGHSGDEALLFVHMRGGVQMGISANFADYDTISAAKAAFNVKPGDVIKVYVVDDLSSDSGQNPNIL